MLGAKHLVDRHFALGVSRRAPLSISVRGMSR
jgi:hypothetical protein